MIKLTTGISMEHRTYYALYCAVIVSLGGFVFGFDAAVISGVVGFVTVEFDSDTHTVRFCCRCTNALWGVWYSGDRPVE